VINDPLALALTYMHELCDYQELPVDVDISGGVSMGKTFADFFNYDKKTANIKVALGVRPRNFIDLFLERMEVLSRIIQ
jgi:inosine-uridine nucleoside N-ribohydrolase